MEDYTTDYRNLVRDRKEKRW